jgi:hypothetical protein
MCVFLGEVLKLMFFKIFLEDFDQLINILKKIKHPTLLVWFEAYLKL